MTGAELAVRNGEELIARAAEGSLGAAEYAVVKTLVRLQESQAFPSNAELALMLRTADHLGLDPWAKQCYFIKFDNKAGWECYPHWSGLVRIAEETGEYQGIEGGVPFYSSDGHHWSDVWLADDPPPMCRVTVLRRGHQPTRAIAYWRRSAKYFTRNGQRLLAPAWASMPEDMLAKAALRLALRRAFPRQADLPLSRAQLRALQTIAAARGLGGRQNRPRRLAAVSAMVGRPLDSFKELSAVEATDVMDQWLPDDAEFGEPEAVASEGEGLPRPDVRPAGADNNGSAKAGAPPAATVASGETDGHQGPTPSLREEGTAPAPDWQQAMHGAKAAVAECRIRSPRFADRKAAAWIEKQGLVELSDASTELLRAFTAYMLGRG